MEINSDFMYILHPNSNDDICELIENSNPDSSDFSTYLTWPYLNSKGTSNKYPDAFEFETKIPFKPLNQCGKTGYAIFRFILTDNLTGISDTSLNTGLDIYGCGDGKCTSEFETVNNCSEDCQ